MALWGNKDNKTATGTVSIASTGVVTGTSTLFTTEAKVGNTITAGGVDYLIITITSNTVAKVVMGANNGNGTVTTASAASYTLSEKPAFVARESISANAGNSNIVYGVDATEKSAGGDNVTSVSLSFAGTRYTGSDAVTFSGGGGSGAAVTTSGTVGGPISSLTVTNTGSGYTSAPTVVIALPRRTITTNNINTTTNLFSFDDHSLVAGDAIKYFHGGGSAAGGLTNNTTYYVIASGLISGTGGKFKVSATSGGSEVDITTTGNNAQYFELTSETDRATAVAALGSGAGGTQITHAGWVRRTVGTGRRAGRIQYETLVAMGSISSDAADDLVLPDA